MKKKKGFVDGWMQKQTKKTRKEIHRPISKDELLFLTALTFIVVFFQVFSMLLNFWNWANTPGLDFGSYHVYSPLVALLGWTGYSYVIFVKGVYKISILPFIPAMCGVLYSIILTLIRWDMLDPSVLKFW